MADEQQSEKSIESKEVEYKIQEAEPAQEPGPSISFTVVPIDITPKLIVQAVKEAGYVMLMPLRSKAVALELEIMNQGKDPFLCFFQLADLIDETYRAWARDPLGGDRRG